MIKVTNIIPTQKFPPPPSGKSGWPWTVESKRAPERRPDGGDWPKMSIITPSFNQGHYIEETIRSVLLQGYPNLEFIIIDGSSTDESLSVISKYNDWVKLIVEDQPRGMSRAINLGLSKVTGDLVTWISSDDVYFPDAFQRIGAAWDRISNFGAVVGAFYFLNDDSKITSTRIKPYLPHPAPIDLTLHSDDWRLHQVATFYLGDALRAVGNSVREDLLNNMDRELLYRIALRYKIHLLDDAIAAFRIHEKSKSWSLDNMITMAREYASIQYMFMNHIPREDALRKRIARYRIAKGYLKFAKYNPSLNHSISALLKCLYHFPAMVLSPGYYYAMADILSIKRNRSSENNPTISQVIEEAESSPQ